jgi:antitoxin (DNA-binding transcriptional repressor) of toxin-antitoxin stability system
MLSDKVIKSIQLSDLENQVREILERVHQDGEIFDITVGDVVFARLVPVPAPELLRDRAAVRERRRRLAEEIGKHWPEGVSAADAVAEGRRDL